MAGRYFRRARRAAAANSPDRSFRGRHRALRCEPLEDRRLLAVVTVDTELDVVDFNDGKTSLREAIFATNTVPGADEIRFAFDHDEPTTILLTQGELRITDSLTVVGLGKELLVIDASGSDATPQTPDGKGSRHFRIDDGSADTLIDVSLSGMTLIHGDGFGSGGAVYSTESLIVERVDFTANYAWGKGTSEKGGGLYSNGNLILRSCVFQENHAGYGGGAAIEATGSGKYANEVYLADVSWLRNSNGGIHLTTSGDSVAIAERIFSSENYSADQGGNRLRASGSSTISVRDSTFTYNRSVSGAGSQVFASESAKVQILSTRFAFNQSAQHGGGIDATLSEYGALIIDGCEITDHRSSINGGAIDVGYAGYSFSGRPTFVLSNSTITRNSAERGGGGIFFNGLKGDALIEGTRLDSNSSRFHGGGLYVESGSDDASLKVVNSEFSSNTASNNGAGAYVNLSTTSGRPSASFDGNQFRLNRAKGDGAGLWLNISSTTRGGEATVKNSLFQSNRAQGDGGGIKAGGETNSGEVKLGMSHLAFRDNEARRGGALHLSSSATGGKSDVWVELSSFERNVATQSGGGIYAAASSNSGKAQLSVRNVFIAGNRATTMGGGIAVEAYKKDAFTLENATITGNAAQTDGGGIWVTGAAELRHSTIADNRADSDGNGSGKGGGLFGSIKIDHVIAAYNFRGTTESATADDASGAIEGFYSIVKKFIGSEAQVAGQFNLLNVDPLLGPLSDNGGPVLPGAANFFTYSLQPGSPAINAGDPAILPGINSAPEFDQRGAPYSRSVGSRVDIGAFERQAAGGVLRADFNFDGIVDGADFLAWQRGFGKQSATFRQGDATADGDVDANDLSVWKVRFGDGLTAATTGAAFSEPAAAGVAEEVEALHWSVPLTPAIEAFARGAESEELLAAKWAAFALPGEVRSGALNSSWRGVERRAAEEGLVAVAEIDGAFEETEEMERLAWGLTGR